MFHLTLNDIRYESRFVARIEQRDQPKRVASVLIILVICYWAGQVFDVLLIGIIILLTEALSRILNHMIPEEESDIPVSLISVLWVNNVISTMVYLLPALSLANQPSIALFLCGFLWLCGSMVHITHTFAYLPFYNFTVTTSSFFLSIGVLVTAGTNDFASSSLWEWAATLVLYVFYMFNAIDSLKKQKDTHRDLRAARRESSARLKKLEHMARIDGLTGLMNRQAFDERLDNFLAEAPPKQPVTVFLIDLDGFKPINDTYSHEVGDQVLVTIAARLRELTGDHGLAARFGGDEFAMAFPSGLNEKSAMLLANRVARRLGDIMHVDNRDLRVTASVGVSQSGPNAKTVPSLCSQADMAMYKAKAERGGQAVLYDPALIKPRPSLEDRRTLIQAIETGQILPYYQPKVDIRTGAICGFEALVRWEHPSRGLIMPGGFLPHISELSLHGHLLSALAERVLSDMDALIDADLQPGQVSINVPELSLATLNGRQDLSSILDQHPQSRGNITFEITEDVFIARATDMIQQSIRHFRAAGVRISLDDFGTGFASFQHLRQLEFDELKIDSSFVAGLGQDPTADVIIEGFLSIARGLGVSAIAEGVETAEQEEQLLRMGCTNVQGFRYGRAIPFSDIRLRLEVEKLRHPTLAAVPNHSDPLSKLG